MTSFVFVSSSSSALIFSCAPASQAPTIPFSQTQWAPVHSNPSTANRQGNSQKTARRKGFQCLIGIAVGNLELSALTQTSLAFDVRTPGCKVMRSSCWKKVLLGVCCLVNSGGARRWTLQLRAHAEPQWISKDLICVSLSRLLSECPERGEHQPCSFSSMSPITPNRGAGRYLQDPNVNGFQMFCHKEVLPEKFSFPFGIQGGLLREAPFKPPGIKGSFLK